MAFILLKKYGSFILLALALAFDETWTLENSLLNLGGEAVSDLLIPLKVCQIAEKRAARVNFVYKRRRTGMSMSMLQLEANLFRCMMPLAIRIMLLEGPKEPDRPHSSLSIFMVPETNTTTDERMKAFTNLLNPKQPNKNAHAYIFIWRGASVAQLEQFFQLVWHKKIFHAIAVVESTKIYTFKPFTATGFQVHLVENEAYFADKLNNLHGSTLRISMFVDQVRARPLPNYKWNGFDAVDGKIARTIAKRLNATAEYFIPADNQNYGSCNNGNFTGSQGDVINGAADVGFNGRFILECVQDHLESFYPYRNRFVYLVVPAAKMIPDFLIFIDAFTTDLWRLLLLSFLIASVVFQVLQKIARCVYKSRMTEEFRWYEVYELVFKTQMGEPVNRFAQISSLRQFLIAWILFSYIVTSVYFAKLESSFVHPTFEPEIDSLDELHKVKTKIYGVQNFFDAIKDSLEPRHFAYINANGVPLPRSYSGDLFFLSMIKESTEVSFILRGATARVLLANSYISELNRPAFHVVKQHLCSLPLTYIAQRGSPYMHKFDRFINIFYEFGFMGHWLKLDTRFLNRDSHKGGESFNSLAGTFDFARMGRQVWNSKNRVVLSLEILQGAFYLWAIGILASIAGFLAEYACWIWKERKTLKELLQASQ